MLTLSPTLPVPCDNESGSLRVVVSADGMRAQVCNVVADPNGNAWLHIFGVDRAIRDDIGRPVSFARVRALSEGAFARHSLSPNAVLTPLPAPPEPERKAWGWPEGAEPGVITPDPGCQHVGDHGFTCELPTGHEGVHVASSVGAFWPAPGFVAPDPQLMAKIRRRASESHLPPLTPEQVKSIAKSAPFIGGGQETRAKVRHIRTTLREALGPDPVLSALDRAPLPSPPAWISVEDMLPEEGVEVLVAHDGCEHLLALFDGAGWRQTQEGNGLDRVTHWQPLPELPEVTDG